MTGTLGIGMDVAALHWVLQQVGVETTTGLNDAEIEQIETEFSFRFPPDLRAFLKQALPVSDRWVNWRASDRDALKERLERPYEGIRFDVEHSEFWMDGWGQRPEKMSDRVEVVRGAVCAAPTLIPIVGHRYIPERPHEAGNPVFSVVQTDIIYYGTTLADFFANEFRKVLGRARYRLAGAPRPIEFWSEIVEYE